MRYAPTLALLLVFSGCAHEYNESSQWLTISRTDEPAVEALVRGIYSPKPGTCAEKARTKTAKSQTPLVISKGIGPLSGAKVYCLDEHAKGPYEFSGVEACFLEMNSKTSAVAIISTGINSTFGAIPPPPERAEKERKRTYAELESTLNAMGIKSTQIPSQNTASIRMCGDY